MAQRRTFIVLNPNSGSGQQTQRLLELAAEREDITLKQTAEAGDGTQLTREAVKAGYDVVIAAGGDGTVHEVVNGLAEDFAAAAMGILPLGSANDLARTLDLPTDLEAALEQIEGDRSRRLDVARVVTGSGQVHYMINAGTGGFSTVVSDNLDPVTKQRWGGLAYIRAALASLPEAAQYDLTVAVDDETPLHMETSALVIANGRYAGRIECVPEAEVDDGQLDLLIVTAQTLLDQAELFASFTIRQHAESDVTVHRRGRHIHIDARPAMTFNIDGEPVGETPITFSVLPGALQLRG